MKKLIVFVLPFIVVACGKKPSYVRRDAAPGSKTFSEAPFEIATVDDIMNIKKISLPRVYKFKVQAHNIKEALDKKINAYMGEEDEEYLLEDLNRITKLRFSDDEHIRLDLDLDSGVGSYLECDKRKVMKPEEAEHKIKLFADMPSLPRVALMSNEKIVINSDFSGEKLYERVSQEEEMKVLKKLKETTRACDENKYF